MVYRAGRQAKSVIVRLLVALGDVCRYKDLCVDDTSKHIAFQSDALSLYRLALVLQPSGRCYGQIGVVCTSFNSVFLATYNFCRALGAVEPCQLREQLNAVLERNRMEWERFSISEVQQATVPVWRQPPSSSNNSGGGVGMAASAASAVVPSLASSTSASSVVALTTATSDSSNAVSVGVTAPPAPIATPSRPKESTATVLRALLPRPPDSPSLFRLVPLARHPFFRALNRCVGILMTRVGKTPCAASAVCTAGTLSAVTVS